MTPRIVDREKKQEEIALKAMELFSEFGFETTSISQIAEALGIGKGTIYEYFSSKEQLIIHSIAVWTTLLEKEIEALVGDIPDPLERLHRYVDVLMDQFTGDERTLNLMVNLFALLTKKEFQGNHMLTHMFHGVHKFIIDILLDGIAQGIFSHKIARDVEKIAINITASLDGIAVHYYVSGSSFDLKEQCHSFLDYWLAGLGASKTD